MRKLCVFRLSGAVWQVAGHPFSVTLGVSQLLDCRPASGPCERFPMAKVMLVQPWNYHDEGVEEHRLEHEWRNGPYSLLLLATELKRAGHEVCLVDMIRDLVMLRGNVQHCLAELSLSIEEFR